MKYLISRSAGENIGDIPKRVRDIVYFDGLNGNEAYEIY